MTSRGRSWLALSVVVAGLAGLAGRWARAGADAPTAAARVAAWKKTLRGCALRHVEEMASDDGAFAVGWSFAGTGGEEDTPCPHATVGVVASASGTAAFAPAYVSALATGDLDGDGRLDLLVSEPDPAYGSRAPLGLHVFVDRAGGPKAVSVSVAGDVVGAAIEQRGGRAVLALQVGDPDSEDEPRVAILAWDGKGLAHVPWPAGEADDPPEGADALAAAVRAVVAGQVASLGGAAAPTAYAPDAALVLGGGPVQAGPDFETAARARFGKKATLLASPVAVSLSADGKVAWAAFTLTVAAAGARATYRVTEVLARATAGWQIAAGFVSLPVESEVATRIGKSGKAPPRAPLVAGKSDEGPADLLAAVRCQVDFCAGAAGVSARADFLLIDTNPGSYVTDGAAYGRVWAGWKGVLRLAGPLRAAALGDVGWAILDVDFVVAPAKKKPGFAVPCRLLLVYARKDGAWSMVQGHLAAITAR
jgi:hypothetical protein